MAQQLILQKKIVSNVGVYFIFDKDGKMIKVPEAEAKALILAYPPNLRNCKLVNDRVSMKANVGEMPIEYQNLPQKDKGKIQICTKSKDKDKCFFKSSVLWFRNIMYDREFLKRNEKLIEQVDHAKIVDYKTLMVVTPAGVTDIDHISTGLKLVLNIRYLLEHKPNTKLMVNADECGDNVLPIIFNDISDTDISLFVTHPIMDMPKGYEIFVNGKLLKDVCTFAMLIE